MNICIDMGHTPTSPGASGLLDELECDRALGQRVIDELKARGHAVYNSTPDDGIAYPDEVNQRVAYVNARDIDVLVSIHLNAGGGTGTEVLYYEGDDTGYTYASRISANLAAALGLPDRGAKGNNWVGVVCNTNATAVLIEVCFVDREEDYAAWNNCSWNDMVMAICNGIDGSDTSTRPMDIGDDDMTFDDVWFGETVNDAKTPATGSGTTPANLIWEIAQEVHELKEQVAELSAKIKE